MGAKKDKAYFAALPKSTRIQVNLNITADERVMLQEKAEAEGCSVPEFIRRRIFTDIYYDREKKVRSPHTVEVDMEAVIAFIESFRKKEPEPIRTGKRGRPRKNPDIPKPVIDSDDSAENNEE